MRRWLLCIVSLIALAATAETHYKPHITIGAHGGYDLSKVSFTPSVKQGWQGGYCAGVQARYAEEKLVGIQMELNFEQRGWSELFEESPLEYSRTFSYVSVPFLTHICFGPPRLKFFFNLGPELSFMVAESIASNFDYTNPTHSPDWPKESRMTEQLTGKINTKFDYGICAGFGCEFYMSPRNSMYLEARYYFGLGNVFSATKADTFSGSRNMTLGITIGYNFRIY